MSERLNGNQVPLFDRMPDFTKGLEAKIRTEFDGTYGNYGIVITLDARTGTPLRAKLTSLLDRSDTKNYVALAARAKWASQKGPSEDVREGTRLFEKLETVFGAVHESWMLWRQEDGHKPQREYTNTRRSATANERVNQELSQTARKPAQKRQVDRSNPVEVHEEAFERILNDPKLRRILGFD